MWKRLEALFKEKPFVAKRLSQGIEECIRVHAESERDLRLIAWAMRDYKCNNPAPIRKKLLRDEPTDVEVSLEEETIPKAVRTAISRRRASFAPEPEVQRPTKKQKGVEPSSSTVSCETKAPEGKRVDAAAGPCPEETVFHGEVLSKSSGTQPPPNAPDINLADFAHKYLPSECRDDIDLEKLPGAQKTPEGNIVGDRQSLEALLQLLPVSSSVALPPQAELEWQDFCPSKGEWQKPPADVQPQGLQTFLLKFPCVKREALFELKRRWVRVQSGETCPRPAERVFDVSQVLALVEEMLGRRDLLDSGRAWETAPDWTTRRFCDGSARLAADLGRLEALLKGLRSELSVDIQDAFGLLRGVWLEPSGLVLRALR